MAFEKERETIAQIVEKHAKAPLTPAHSAPVARSIARHAEQLKIKPPLAIRRFMDRLDGPEGDYGIQNKLARDLHQKEYADLSEDEQERIRDINHKMRNPAGSPPYFKAGFDFAQGHNLLLAAYSDEKSAPKQLRFAMLDFSKALERDLDEAAKHSGFFKEYSDANMALKIATAGPHRATQTIPVVTSVRR
jgi:hypothetical protein